MATAASWRASAQQLLHLLQSSGASNGGRVQQQLESLTAPLYPVEGLRNEVKGLGT